MDGSKKQLTQSEIEQQEALGHFKQSLTILARIISTAIIKEMGDRRRTTPNTFETTQPFPRDSPNHIEKLTNSVAEAGELLGLSRPSTHEAIKQGQIPSIRFGKRIVVPRAALEKMLPRYGSDSRSNTPQEKLSLSAPTLLLSPDSTSLYIPGSSIGLWEIAV